MPNYMAIKPRNTSKKLAAEIPCGQSTVSRIGQKWIRERVIV